MDKSSKLKYVLMLGIASKHNYYDVNDDVNNNILILIILIFILQIIITKRR